MANRARTIRHGQFTMSCTIDYTPGDGTNARQGYSTAQVDGVLDLVDRHFGRILDRGLPLPGAITGPRSCQLLVNLRPGNGGTSSGGTIRVGSWGLTGGNGIVTEQTVAHELFHESHANSVERGYFWTFAEALTTVASYALTEASAPRFWGALLTTLDEPLWDRPGPATEETSPYHPAGFLAYLMDKVSPTAGKEGVLEGIRDYIAQTPQDGAGLTAPDNPRPCGDLLGTGEDLVLVESADDRLGLMSTNRVHGLRGHTHDIVAVDERFGRGWRRRRGDSIEAVGDFMGLGRDQVFLRSADEEHWGLVGWQATDGGILPTVTSQTHATWARDTRYGGGWRIRRGDRVVGTGYFRTGSRKQVLLRSTGPTYFGIIGFDRNGEASTLAARPEGYRLGSNGWLVRAGDEVVGVGSFLGGSAEQFLLRSTDGHLGLIGLTRSGFRTIAVLDPSQGQRFGGGWGWNRGDEVLGVGPLTGLLHDRIVLRNRTSIGVVGFTSQGEPETLAVRDWGDTSGSWTHRSSDVLVGIGNLLGGETSQLVLWAPPGDDPSRSRLAALPCTDAGFGDAVLHDPVGQLRREDSTAPPPEELPYPDRPFQVGNFSGRVRDQIMVRRADDGLTSLLAVDDLDAWRNYWWMGARANAFSDLPAMERFVASRNDDLASLWRDFGITLALARGRESRERYQLLGGASVDTFEVAGVAWGATRQCYQPNWAIRAYATVAQGSSLRVQLRQTQGISRVRWSVLVGDDDARITSRTGSATVRLSVQPEQKVQVVVASLFSSVNYTLTVGA